MKKFVVKKVTNYNEINLEKCVSWMYNWWGQSENWTREKITTYMKSSFNNKILPQTIIVFNEKHEEVGICQVTLHDLDCRPDIYPYIANLFIDEKYRGNGLVKMLLDEAIKTAKEMNLSHLYIYTTHIGLYEKYGWKFIDFVETYLNPHIQRLYRYDLL